MSCSWEKKVEWQEENKQREQRKDRETLGREKLKIRLNKLP